MSPWKRHLPPANHRQVAERAISAPKQWVRVSEYRSNHSANATALRIRTGATRAYLTAGGQFEPTTQMVGAITELWVRYLPEPTKESAV